MGATVDQGSAHTIRLEGSAAGDSIFIEDGGTDGSGTNAGDEILLETGDKLIQQSVDEGSLLVHEDEPFVSDVQTRKDYLVLNEGSGRKQVWTEYGWLDEARATTLKIKTIGSQKVFIPSTNNTTSEVDGWV